MGIPQVIVDGVDSVSLIEVDVPTAASDDVLVRVEQCGICRSDLGYISMGGLLGPGVPMHLGHEISGSVVEVGSKEIFAEDLKGFLPASPSRFKSDPASQIKR